MIASRFYCRTSQICEHSSRQVLRQPSKWSLQFCLTWLHSIASKLTHLLPHHHSVRALSSAYGKADYLGSDQPESSKKKSEGHLKPCSASSFCFLTRPLSFRLRHQFCFPALPDHQRKKTIAQFLHTEIIMDHGYMPNLSGTFDPSEPVNVATPSAAGNDDSREEESICRECRQVDWDSLAAQGEQLQRTERPLVLRTIEGNHEQLATYSCKICRILSVIKPQSLDDTKCFVAAQPFPRFLDAYAIPSWSPESKTTSIRVCRTDSIYPRGVGDNKCLAVIRRDSLESSSRTITPRLINYDWLKRLAQSCKKNHEQSCGPSLLGAVSGLKVIEISSRTVIEAPAECQYVALSYVWGKHPGVIQTEISHLQNLPPLIEDALLVTIAMGYKYLWVDRYVSRNNLKTVDVLVWI